MIVGIVTWHGIVHRIHFVHPSQRYRLVPEYYFASHHTNYCFVMSVVFGMEIATMPAVLVDVEKFVVNAVDIDAIRSVANVLIT